MDDLIRLTGMYESQKKATGQTYFVGYLGSAKVLLLKDQRAAEGQPGWALMVAPRPEKRDQAGRQDRATDDAPPPATEDTGQGARQRRDRAAAADPAMQAPAGGTATERVADRARAARAAGDLPFDDEIGF